MNNLKIMGWRLILVSVTLIVLPFITVWDFFEFLWNTYISAVEAVMEYWDGKGVMFED